MEEFDCSRIRQVPHDCWVAQRLTENGRNFGIIAHIDHGKSTLADRLLELTGTISKSGVVNKQVLDKLKVERERGITGKSLFIHIEKMLIIHPVKAQTASMLYNYNDKQYLLNLIDTPVHVDFSWEVSRSMAACQGALLLVDATQGIQAQSISVYHVARDRGVHIIPVLNKIDLPASSPERIAAQMQHTFNISPSDILHVSAKTGQGVPELLQAIVDRVPPPAAGQDAGAVTRATMRALLFDSQYDRYRGVVSLVSLQSGQLRDKIASCHTRKRYDIVDIGIMHPEEESTEMLQAGQVGYITCNMKESSEAHIGDTLHHAGEQVDPLPGFRPAKAMVFAGVYPLDSNEFPKLEESVKRLLLTDRSVTANRESSASLGQGIRLGALGSLHMDVLRQRLEDEYGAQVIVTAPTVPYRLVLRNGHEKEVSNPVDFPEPGDIGNSGGSTVHDILEPIVHATIIVPEEYIGNMLDLCSAHRATDLGHTYLSDSDSRMIVRATLPLSEIVTDFHDRVKHRSSGFASFDYEAAGYARADVVKVGFALNGKPVDALALIVGKDKAPRLGRAWVKKLKEVVPRQLFEIAIQATIGSKVIARETLSAQRKDVTAGLYGGHYERKLKVLNKQKEGKKKMKRIGNVELPQEAFYDVLSSKIE
ncbi:elongation factor-type GTP-binding protein [Rhizoctonia solani AG-3 Rhs1AP]|uniref:Elongation factor-type GTP-binding protein n=1 Tax=Rhizoctonia solani AG-3 Rhs1AP TaxID=1086054 RepID=X8JEI4_9AGAM|nr:elongation factor-type GTP-binding protein [Rhizoctonia solani AG-3 Rhs1AP]